MAESVDTRIVEAKFDSSQFEEGVNKTVKKLEELKKSLNLKDTETSVTDLASKTSEATGKMSSSLEQLENRLTTFTGMLKNKLLSGIADEVVSSIYRIKNSFESLVSSLSTGQISYGLNRYTEIMGSVRTLTFSGVDQSVAYDTIERLGTYADQTSYSLDQLVSTMSKFKTAGADLDTAERMVIGASNAAASMGVNATDAARAYLNLQQAYSKGYMQQNDWQSFESLPMVGTKFNQAILDAAVNIGTLEKQADGTYKTINKIDKTVKTSGADSKGITAENLGTKLSSKWFTKKVMEEVFGSTYYFNVTGDDASETISGIKDYEKAMKTVGDGVKKEQENLQEQLKSKSITDEEYIEQVSEIMGSKTYSEIVSKGLEENAPSSEEIKNTISGYLKENADKLEDISYDDLYTKQFEAYLDTVENKQLEEETARLDKLLAEEKITIEEYNEQLEEFKKNNNLTQFGWEAFRAGQEARSFTDVLNTLKDTISRGWATSFELIIGKLDKASEFFTWLTDNKLANAIYAIGDFRNAVLEVWAGGADDEGSGRSMLITTLETLDDLIGRILSHFTMFSDDEDAVKSAANSIGQNLTRMTRNLRDFVDKVNAWFTEERITKIVTFVNTVKTIIGTVSSFAGAAAGFATSLLATLWPVFEAVVENISKIITRVSEIFNTDDANAEDGLSSLQTGFENILLAVQPLVEPLTNFVNILGEIGLFFAEMFAGTAVSNLEFFADTLGFVLEVLGLESSQSKAEKGVSVLDKIKNSVIELGTACKDTFNFVFDFFRSLYDDLRLVLKMREAEEGEEGGFFTNIVKFFETSEFIKNVKAKFTEVWQTIDTFFFGEEVEKKEIKNGKLTTWTERSTSEFSKMIDSAIKAISTFATKTVPKYAKKIWENITDFLFGKKIVAVKYNNGQYITTYTRFKSGFSEFLDKVFKAIKTFIVKDLPKAVSDVWNKVVEALFGKKEVEAAVNSNTSGKNDATDKVKGGFSKWLTQAIESVKSWIVSIPGTIKSLWNTIVDVIFYRDAKPDEINPDTGTAYAPNTRVLNAFAEWVKNIPNNILEWLKNDLPEKAAEIWDKVIDFIFGKDVEPGTVNPETGKDYPPNTRIKEGFSAWLDTAVQTVKDWIKTAKETIAGLWDIVLDSIFGYNDPSDVNRYTTKKNGSAEKLSANAAEGIVQTIGSGISEEFESDDTARKGILGTARTFIENLGIDIGKLLSELPTYIVEGWNSSLNIFKDLAERITGWMRGINLAEATEESVANSFDNPEEGSLISAIVKFGQSIVEIVTKVLPPLFSEGWRLLATHADDLWNAVKSIFGIKDIRFEDLGKQAEAFGTKVADTIRSIPGFIRTAVEAVKKEFAIEEFDIEIWKSLYAENPQYADEYQQKFAGKQRNGLWEAIKSIFGSVGDVIEDLGPDILNAINEALIWLGEKLTFVTEAFGDKKEDESIGQAIARRMGSEDTEKEPSGIVLALTSIGKTIYDLIVNIIPNFIKNGISVLIQEVPKLIGQIGNAFNSDQMTDAASQANEELVKSIGGLFSSNETSTDETFHRIMEGSLSGVVDRIEFLNALSEKKKEMTAALEGFEKGTPEYTELSNNLTDLETFMATVGAAEGKFYNLANSQYSSSDIQALDKYITKEEKLKELEKIRNERNQVVMDLVKEKRTNVLDTSSFKDDPEYLRAEADLEEVKQLIEEVKNSSDEYVLADKYVQTTENAKKNSGIISDNIMEMIGNFASLAFNSDTGKIIALAGLITVLVYNIRMIVDNIQFVDDIGYTFKWFGLSVLFSGIVAILGYVTYLAATGDKTKFDNVTSTFEAIASFIERLGNLITIIAAIKGVSDITTSFMDWRTAVNDNQASSANKSGGLLGFFSNILGNLLGFAGKTGIVLLETDAIADSVTEFFEGIQGVASQIGVAVEQLMSSIEPGVKRLADLNGVLDDAIEAFGKFVELLGQMRKLISEENKYATMPESFYKIVTDAEGNVQSMDTTSTFLSNYYSTNLFHPGDLKEVDAQESFEKRIAWIYRFTEFLYELGNALHTLEQVDNPAETIKKATSILTDPEYGFGDLLKALFSAFKVETGAFSSVLVEAEELDDMSLSLRLLGDALSIFTASVGSLSSDQITVLDHALKVIQSLVNLVNGSDDTIRIKEGTWDWFIGKGDNTIGSFGRVIAVFGTNMETFFTHVKAINADESKTKILEDNTSLVLKTVRSFVASSKYLDSADKVKNFKDLFNDITGLGTSMMTFLNEIATFETAENFDIEFIKDVVGSIKTISEMFGTTELAKVYHERDEEKIEILKKMLIGEDGEHGFIAMLLDIHAALKKIKENASMAEDSQFTFDDTVEGLKILSLLTENINEIIRGVDLPDGSGSHPFDKVVETLSSFNSQFETIKEFIDLATQLDQNGIANSVSVFGSIRDLAEAIHYFGEDTFGTGYDNLISFDFAAFINSIIESLNGTAEGETIYDSAFSIGRNVDAGLAKGISFRGEAITAAKNLATKIGDVVKEVLKISSPSKVMEEYGMYMDEGLAQGIAKYSYDPLVEAGDMADSLVDKMRRVLANPNAPDSLKAQVQNLLDNMVDEGTYNQALEGFGAKLGEDAGQTMRAVTEEEMKKAAEANQSGPGFLDYVTLAWNRIWNTDSDIPGFKSRFVQNAENIIDGTWGMLKDKIVEGANKVGPTFTETVMGILAEHEESSWELDESAFHLLVDNFNVLLGAALTDLKDNSTSAIKKKGIDLFGEIMNAATDESQGGNLFSRIGNALFGDIKDYINQNKYVAMARSVFSNIFNVVKDESSENSGVVATTIFDSILSSTNAVSGNSAAFDAILGALHSFWDTAQVTMEQDLSLTPQVAPQLVLTDQFMADASKISQLVGGNINPSVLSGLNFGLNGALNTTLDMANQLDTPTTFDYTAQLSDILHKISDMNSNVKAFDTALRNTRFVINGDRLTDVIGPSMDEWLGREGFYVARRNAT